MALPDFDSLWDYDHPAETGQKFRALLDTAKESGDTSYYAQLLTQIARTQGLQRKFGDAHRTLDEVQSLLKGNLVRGRAHIRYLLERGRAFNSSKHPDQARPLLLEAWEMARNAGEDFYAVDAAHMMGIVALADAQEEWNLKAMAVAEKSADPAAHKWLGSLCNNMGWTHHNAGRFEQAMEMFEKALKFRQQQADEPQIQIATWCVARCLRSLGRVEEALAMQRALEQEGEGMYVYEEIAECLLLLIREAEARPYLAKAYDMLSKDPWLAENEPARLERLKKLGQL